jgi:hypothetical protein
LEVFWSGLFGTCIFPDGVSFGTAVAPILIGGGVLSTSAVFLGGLFTPVAGFFFCGVLSLSFDGVLYLGGVSSLPNPKKVILLLFLT